MEIPNAIKLLPDTVHWLVGCHKGLIVVVERVDVAKQACYC